MQMSEHFNEIMPQSDDRVLCLRITKPITGDGYQQNFITRLDQMIDRHGEIRLLVWYADYKGWEEDAARNNMLSAVQYGQKICKVAMIDPPQSRIIDAKIKAPLLSGEVRIFTATEFDQALDWVRT
jgi:hypothetical protein